MRLPALFMPLDQALAPTTYGQCDAGAGLRTNAGAGSALAACKTLASRQAANLFLYLYWSRLSRQGRPREQI